MSMSRKGPKPVREILRIGMRRVHPFEEVFHTDDYALNEKDDIIVFNKKLLQAITMGRNDLCFCGSGKKQKKCHKNFNENSIVANLWQKNNYFDCLRDEQVLENKIEFICKEGCNNCCDEYFYVSEVEYYLIKNHILTFMPNVFNELKKVAKEQYIQLAEYHGEEYKRLNTTIKKITKDFFDDKLYIEKYKSCILLGDDDRCIAYEARPFICKFYGTSNKYFVCDKIYNEMEKVDKKEKEFFLKKTMVSIPYNDFFKEGVDIVGEVLQRAYPLFYWFSHDENYEKEYNYAVNYGESEYIRKKVEGY